MLILRFFLGSGPEGFHVFTVFFSDKGPLGCHAVASDFSPENGGMDNVLERDETGFLSIRQHGSWNEIRPFFLGSACFLRALRPLHV